MEMKFYRCPICGQIVGIVHSTYNPIVCCGLPMKELIAKEEETEFKEKHVPTFRIKKNKLIVYVGLKPHPCTLDHHIEWIAVKTNKGNQRKNLEPEEPAKATFCIDDDEVVEEIYSYCNVHSLWKLSLTSKK